jgi:hypothetical protein
MTILECKNTTFFSQLDETSFFERIDQIKCIKRWEGVSNSIVLHIKTKTISDNCLRELISLFHRYKIEMSQLSCFLDKKNKKWFFDNKESFWHKKIFKNHQSL